MGENWMTKMAENWEIGDMEFFTELRYGIILILSPGDQQGKKQQKKSTITSKPHTT